MQYFFSVDVSSEDCYGLPNCDLYHNPFLIYTVCLKSAFKICNSHENCQLYVCNFMKSELCVAITIFIRIYITILDIVRKCYCQIVSGTLPYCYTDVACVCHILCHRILLLHSSVEMCGCAHVKNCVCVSHVHVPVLVRSVVTLSIDHIYV
jgi:hypothetical protein